MSCQNKIEEIIKKDQRSMFTKYGNDSYFKKDIRSHFKIIENFDFSGYVRNIKTSADGSFSKTYKSSKNAADNIFSIITSNKYQRKGKYNKSDYDILCKIVRSKIRKSVSKKEKISLVVPGFTTKAFNILRVESRRLPDLAEFVSLARLYEICYQIGKVYKPGAEFVVVTDGQAYAKIFEEDPYFAVQHRENLETWVKNCGIDSHVKIVDLVTLLPHHFSKEYSLISNLLAEEWGNTKDVSTLAEFVTNSKNLVNYEREIVADLKLFYHLQDEYEDHEFKRSSINDLIVEKAIKTTFRYEVFLRTSYKLEVIDKSYPNSIRCTGRPKPGQLGINMIHERSNNFPWNGVGVWLKSGRIDVYPESSVKYSDRFTPVFIKGDHSAFYYKEN